MNKRVILAITGASGTLFAVEFLKLMRANHVDLYGIISDAGRQVMHLELKGTPEDLNKYVIQWYDVHDFTAPIASGTNKFDGMVVLPCSMGTLAAIAGGISGNLIHRAADVSLKERRPLVLAVRETPLNRTHLLNMIKAHEAGSIVCPPMPAMYHRPKSLEEMAAIFAERVAGQLGIEVPGKRHWTGIPE